MGAIAEAFVAYAQPLLDQTDGSEEQIKRAFAISQFCYNLALVSDESRDEALSKMRLSLKMNDEEFDAFRRSIIQPMIQRHQQMFSRMHGRDSTDFSRNGPSSSGPGLRTRSRIAASVEAYPGTDRYAPCPCDSGRKYKFCCGKKSP